MNDREKNELRSSLGARSANFEDPQKSEFKSRFENFIFSLPVDEVWRYLITGLIWPVSIFYLSSTFIGAVILEIIFWLVVITQGWPLYAFIAFGVFSGSIIYWQFGTPDRWIRYSFWTFCSLLMLYIWFPFDVRAHESSIAKTSTHIIKVDFPTFDKSLENPKIYIDQVIIRDKDDFYEDFIKKTAFYNEFRLTCQVGLQAAKDGAGILFLNETFEKVDFVLSNSEIISFSTCTEFDSNRKPKLSIKVEPTWDTKNSVDVWGRFDFVGSEFPDIAAPSGTQVEVLVSDPSDGVNFVTVAYFELKTDWYGEVSVVIKKPMLGKLRMKAQNNLPETVSEVILLEPRLK